MATSTGAIVLLLPLSRVLETMAPTIFAQDATISADTLLNDLNPILMKIPPLA